MEELPLVEVGDRIKVYWPNEDGTTDKIRANVISIEKCKKIKQNSSYKYTLRISNNNYFDGVLRDERTTRLLHMKWKKIPTENTKKIKQKQTEIEVECIKEENDNIPSEKKRKRKTKSTEELTEQSITASPSSNSSPNSSAEHSIDRKNVLPTHSRIVAPMVGGSELAFRLLCRYVRAKLYSSI